MLLSDHPSSSWHSFVLSQKEPHDINYYIKLPEPRIYLPLSKCQLIWLHSTLDNHEGPPFPANVQTMSPKPLRRRRSSLCKGAVWYKSFPDKSQYLEQSFPIVLTKCITPSHRWACCLLRHREKSVFSTFELVVSISVKIPKSCYILSFPEHRPHHYHHHHHHHHHYEAFFDYPA